MSIFTSSNDDELRRLENSQRDNNDEGEGFDIRHLLWIVPTVALALVGLLTYDNITLGVTGGALMGFAIGLLVRGKWGYSKKDLIRKKKDPSFVLEKKWTYPQWLRVLSLCVGLPGAVLWMVAPTSSVWTIVGAGFFVAAFTIISFWGRWKGWGNGIGSWVKARKPKSAAEAKLEDFTPSIFYDAALVSKDVTLSTSDATSMRVPRIVKKTVDAQGNPAVRVTLVPGKTFESFERAAETLATSWRVAFVKVSHGERLDNGEHTVWLTAMERDSVLNPDEAILWARPSQEELAKPVVEYLDNLFIGKNKETGESYRISMSERNFLIAGTPGSGKSSLANALIGYGALHPDVVIEMLDLKSGVEADAWGTALNGAIDNTVGYTYAKEFLKLANADMKRRYARMKQAGVTNAWKEGFLGHDEPVKILIVDECSGLFTNDNVEQSKFAAEVTSLLQRYVEQGRAAGYILIMSTQFPKAQNLPTAIRSNVSDNIALRMRDSLGVSASLGSDFIPKRTTDPTKITTVGGAVIRNLENPEGVSVQFCYITGEDKKWVIDNANASRPWLRNNKQWRELEEQARQEIAELERQEALELSEEDDEDEDEDTGSTSVQSEQTGTHSPAAGGREKLSAPLDSETPAKAVTETKKRTSAEPVSRPDPNRFVGQWKV